ncbi:ATP-binding protein [Nocardia tengchongensis]|uniref:hypothetical protein n=1 Tax=Nocardia tengchongensis TaxID=2055889 RepID=UPI0036A604D2
MRLRQLIFALLIADGVLMGLTVAVAFARPTVWVFAMLALLALEGLVFVTALRAAGRGGFERAITTISVSIWTGALAASWLSPFTLPLHVVAALIPAISAIPYVRRRRLLLYCLATLATTFGCAALALPVIASVVAPMVAKYLATIGFPAVTAPVLLVVWHTAATLGDMAAIARRNADALRSSQRLLAEHAEQLTRSRARLVAATDAGCGFDPTRDTDGTGLTNMRDRLAVIGGTLLVDSAPGRGTRLTATVPTGPLPGTPDTRDR